MSRERLTAGAATPFVLSATPAATAAYGDGHYLVPDTNVFLHCMDAVEHRAAFHDVVVLQTVLEELRHRSLPLYGRLRALAAAGAGGAKRFYVFHNEFRRDTHVRRRPGESSNDRNDRAVRAACAWYRAHLAAATAAAAARCPAVVMLSDDRDNLRRARAEGIACSNGTVPRPSTSAAVRADNAQSRNMSRACRTPTSCST